MVLQRYLEVVIVSVGLYQKRLSFSLLITRVIFFWCHFCKVK
jgi:hypothetical protein